MSLGGDLSKIDLTAIFQTLALNQQVGTLVVTEKDTGRKTSLYFDQNAVALVASDKRNYFRLGQILVNRGIINDDVLRRALEQQKRNGGLLGEVLVELGVTTEDEIEDIVRSQIEEEIFELFQWKNARFEFLEGAPPSKTGLDGYITSIAFDPNSLLMEAARRLDEWERMKGGIASLQEILIIDEEAWDDEEFENLSVSDRAVIDLLDGERDIQDIAEETSLPRFQICKTLYTWLQSAKVRSLTAEELEALAGEAEKSNSIPLAIKFYERAIIAVPESEKICERLAHCYELIGESRKSAKWFTDLGEIRWEEGRVVSAVDAYQRAAKLNPGQTVALERLFEHSANEGDVPGVLATGKALLKSYMKDLQVSEAADLCRGLLERFPADLDLRKQMINIHLDRRDAKAAAKEYEEILELLKKDRAWAEMADVCSKIVQLDPDRDEYRPLIESYRARSERSFGKLIKKPIFVLPLASLALAIVLGFIGYNVLAGREWKKAADFAAGGSEESALEQYHKVAGSYPFSIYARGAKDAAENLTKTLRDLKEQLQRDQRAMGVELQAGQDALAQKRLVIAEEAFKRAQEIGKNKVFQKAPTVVKELKDRVARLLKEIEDITSELNRNLESAEEAIKADDLDGASSLLDGVTTYQVWAAQRERLQFLRNRITRLRTETKARALHEAYKLARQAELRGDRAQAVAGYTRCLEFDLINLEYRDAERFLQVAKSSGRELETQIASIRASYAKQDWQGNNTKLLRLLQEFPNVRPDDIGDLRYHIVVGKLQPGSKVTLSKVNGGEVILPPVTAEADGTLVVEPPPGLPGEMQLEFDQPGFRKTTVKLTEKTLSDPGQITTTTDKEPFWTFPAPPAPGVQSFKGGVTVAGGRVYAPNRNGKLYVLDLSTGKELWHYEGARDVDFNAVAAVKDGVAYVGMLNGPDFIGVNEGSAGAGSLVLQVPVPGHVVAQAALSGGLVVVGSSDGKVRALNADGRQQWEFPADGPIEADIATDGTSFYVATTTGKVHCIDFSGKERWVRDAGGSVVARMAISSDAIFVGTLRSSLIAFKLSDGVDHWPSSHLLGREIEVRGGCAVMGDMILVAATTSGKTGSFFLISAATSVRVLAKDVGDEPLTAPPLVSGADFYLGTTYMKGGQAAGGGLYALQMEGDQLRERWHWQSNHPIIGQMALSGGILVVATADGLVLGFEE